MEPYIAKISVIDITYQSELILDILKHCLEAKCQGLNSSFALLRTRWTILNKVKNLALITYSHLRARKLCAHLK